MQDRSVFGSSSMKRQKDHSCRCWCCFSLMISCWLDAKVKPVGKRVKEECTTSENGLSGNKDTRACLELTSRNFRTEASWWIRRLTWTTLIQLKSNLNDGRRQRHLWQDEKIPHCEVSGEPCNGRAHRRMQQEHVPCQCYNRFRPVAADGTLMKSNRIRKEMKSDLVALRVRDYRNEKLAVVVWSDAARPTGKTCPQRLVSFQEPRQHESCKAEDMVWLRFIIVLENRNEKQDRVWAQKCKHWLTQNKSYTSRDCKWQSFLDFLWIFVLLMRRYSALMVLWLQERRQSMSRCMEHLVRLRRRKTNNHSDDGNPRKIDMSECYCTVVSRRSKPQWWTNNQGNAENAVGVLLWRWMCMESCRWRRNHQCQRTSTTR